MLLPGRGLRGFQEIRSPTRHALRPPDLFKLLISLCSVGRKAALLTQGRGSLKTFSFPGSSSWAGKASAGDGGSGAPVTPRPPLVAPQGPDVGPSLPQGPAVPLLRSAPPRPKEGAGRGCA